MPMYKIAWFWSTVFRDVQIQCLHALPSKRSASGSGELDAAVVDVGAHVGYLEYRVRA